MNYWLEVSSGNTKRNHCEGWHLDVVQWLFTETSLSAGDELESCYQGYVLLWNDVCEQRKRKLINESVSLSLNITSTSLCFFVISTLNFAIFETTLMDIIIHQLCEHVAQRTWNRKSTNVSETKTFCKTLIQLIALPIPLHETGKVPTCWPLDLANVFVKRQTSCLMGDREFTLLKTTTLFRTFKDSMPRRRHRFGK